MTQCNKVNIKLSYSQLNKLKSTAENQTRVTLRMNMSMFDGDKQPDKLLLTIIQSYPRHNYLK